MSLRSSAFGRRLHRTADVFAITAGVLLCVLALLVIVSVSGRVLFLSPILGDFELVANGTAVVAFLSLPYCQLHRGNITVDFFLARAPARARAALDAASALLFGLIALVFGLRMCGGLRDAFVHQDVTVIVGMPLWLAYPFGIASFLLLAVCCVYCALEELQGAGT